MADKRAVGKWPVLSAVMSALGQKQVAHPMSALPPIADIRWRYSDVRFVPTADIAAPEPERGHRRKSLPLAVNKDAYDYRRKGEHD